MLTKNPNDKTFDSTYYTNSGFIANISSDISNNALPLIGDVFNILQFIDAIKKTISNYIQKIKRNKFKQELISSFLTEYGKNNLKIYQHDDLSTIRSWFADKCREKNIILSITDIHAWEEKLLLIQQRAILRNKLNQIQRKDIKQNDWENFKTLRNRLSRLYISNNKINTIKTQTIASTIKHAVFGIGGILGMCGITFGVVMLAIAAPITIPLIAAVGFQTLSGICTALWTGANGIENGAKFNYAKSKKKKLQQDSEDLREINNILQNSHLLSSKKKEFNKLIADKDITKIRVKKERNSKLRYQMEKYRLWSLGAIIGGAVSMSLGSILGAIGLLLTSSLVGSVVGVPLSIVGGILGTLGAVSFIGGYAGQVWIKSQELKKQENNRLLVNTKEKIAEADKINTPLQIAQIIKKDPELQNNKIKLAKIQRKSKIKTLGLTLIGLIVAIPAIPLSFFLPPVAIACTAVATSLLALGIWSSIYTVIKTRKIHQQIEKRKFELVNKVKEMPGYENMPTLKPQIKISFWKKTKLFFANIFAKKKAKGQSKTAIEKLETSGALEKSTKFMKKFFGPRENTPNKCYASPKTVIKAMINQNGDLSSFFGTTTNKSKTLVTKYQLKQENKSLKTKQHNKS
jgi:hypothetical protein